MHSPFMGFGWALIWILAILVFSTLARRERARLYDMVERAAREGYALPPEVLERLRRRRWFRTDLRSGVIFLALGVGLLIGGIINFETYTGPRPELFHGPYGLFPIPLCLGVAFLLMDRLRRPDDGGR
jgi:hypothetical protein